jgi:hypothetical protein
MEKARRLAGFLHFEPLSEEQSLLKLNIHGSGRNFMEVCFIEIMAASIITF